jgi:hypothetical protein
MSRQCIFVTGDPRQIPFFLWDIAVMEKVVISVDVPGQGWLRMNIPLTP